MKRARQQSPDERPVKRQRQQPPLRSLRSASAPPFSPAACGRRAPLTEANVRAFDRSIAPSMSNPQRGLPPSRRASTKASSDTRSHRGDKLLAKEQLHIYRIFCEQNDALPPGLAAHCQSLRQPRNPVSPNARNIAAKALEAQSMGEQDGIDALKRHLLFLGATDGGRAHVRHTAKPNFNTRFLPTAPNTTVADAVAALQQPQPDYAFGYIPLGLARKGRVDAPFTEGQEDQIHVFCLTPEVHFPYLTAQWKSSAKGGTQDQAILQAARDGATIVRYLYDFYRKAQPLVEPSVVQTCHYSVTVDMRTVLVFVHWRGLDGAYHMEQIESGFTAKERDMTEVRAVLANIQDFALATRLEAIKTALNQLQMPAPSAHTSAAYSEDRVALPSAYVPSAEHPPSLTVASSSTSISDLHGPSAKRRRRNSREPEYWFRNNGSGGVMLTPDGTAQWFDDVDAQDVYRGIGE